VNRQDGSTMDLSHPFETEERWEPAEESPDATASRDALPTRS